MTIDEGLRQRLSFLIRVIEKEQGYLSYSYNKLFAESEVLTSQQMLSIQESPESCETLEAFVSRFCRLQDNIGDKLLISWMKAVQEKPGTFIDNLDRAEKLGLLLSADSWIMLRQSRNKMIHEYIEDIHELTDAVNMAKQGIELLTDFADNLIADVRKRLATE